jgi:cell division protein FtsL
MFNATSHSCDSVCLVSQACHVVEAAKQLPKFAEELPDMTTKHQALNADWTPALLLNQPPEPP